MIVVGSRVVLNDRYRDRREYCGTVMTVTRLGELGSCAVAYTDLMPGPYAIDGFDEVEEGGDTDGQEG